MKHSVFMITFCGYTITRQQHTGVVYQWRTQDFLGGGGGHQPLTEGRNLLFGKILAENCLKN